MGLGLGTLVDAHGTGAWAASATWPSWRPACWRPHAMQAGGRGVHLPGAGSVKWRSTYYAAAASPLRPADIFHGHLLFTTMRLAMNAAMFLAVMAAFGAIASPWALAALPVAVLTGLAFAAPVEAFARSR